MRHVLTLAALAFTLLACSTTGPGKAAAPARPAPPPVKDRDLGLSRTSVFEVPAPPAWRIEDSQPGEKPLPARLSTELPPVIPHGIADILPITREANGCVDCHAAAGPKVAGEPTPLPRSHYVDYRNAPEKVGEKVAGARWVCISCHVPRSDAPPAVGSTFRP